MRQICPNSSWCCHSGVSLSGGNSQTHPCAVIADKHTCLNFKHITTPTLLTQQRAMSEKKRRWTKDETEKLLSEIEQKRRKNESDTTRRYPEIILDDQWVSIASCFDGRWTPQQCRSKWKNNLQRQQKVTREEEKISKIIEDG